MRKMALLGPQADQPRVAEALQRFQIKGKVCAVTAGWQERAGELEDLRNHLDREVVHLELYRRAEQIFEADPEYFEAHRRRQNRVRGLQELYRRRLSQYLEAVRYLVQKQGDEKLLAQERADAVQIVQTLDQHHLDRLSALNQEFEEEWETSRRPAVRAQRRKVKQLISDCEAVLVAGGHVAVLLNRLRLFDLPSLVKDKPVIAWSGGAMVLGQQIVLFHDSPPQGPGSAEVMERGLGMHQGWLVLPHARTRLRLTDPVRVSIFARRFAAFRCVPFDEGAFLELSGRKWTPLGDLFRMARGGGLERLESA